jgi:hypothetical protein
MAEREILRQREGYPTCDRCGLLVDRLTEERQENGPQEWVILRAYCHGAIERVVLSPHEAQRLTFSRAFIQAKELGA